MHKLMARRLCQFIVQGQAVFKRLLHVGVDDAKEANHICPRSATHIAMIALRGFEHRHDGLFLRGNPGFDEHAAFATGWRGAQG